MECILYCLTCTAKYSRKFRLENTTTKIQTHTYLIIGNYPTIKLVAEMRFKQWPARSEPYYSIQPLKAPSKTQERPSLHTGTDNLAQKTLFSSTHMKCYGEHVDTYIFLVLATNCSVSQMRWVLFTAYLVWIVTL